MTADDIRASMLAEVQADARAAREELYDLRATIAGLTGHYSHNTEPTVVEIVAALREAAGLQQRVVLDQGEVTELDAESRRILREE